MVKDSWQRRRLKAAEALAKRSALMELIDYSHWIKSNIDLKPHFRKDVLMVAKAIEIKTRGV